MLTDGTHPRPKILICLALPVRCSPLSLPGSPVQVGSLKLGQEYYRHLVTLYNAVMNHLAHILPPGTNIGLAYENGSDNDQAFVQNLGLFFTGFFKARKCPAFSRIPAALT